MPNPGTDNPSPALTPLPRHASGLVRDFALWDTFVFNTIGFALGFVIVLVPGLLASTFPSADVRLVLVFGTILTLFNGLVYGMFGAAMPRSGGDYVFIGRVLTPAIGFISSWGFTWSQLLGLGVYGAWTITSALSPALISFGNVTGHPALTNAGTAVGQPVWVFALGTLTLLSVGLVLLRGTRVLVRLLDGLFVVAIAGTVAMGIVLFRAQHADFIVGLPNLMRTLGHPELTYGGILALAAAHGWVAPSATDTWLASLKALPIGYWVFVGFTFSVYVGGEVQEPQRTQIRAILAALFFGFISYFFLLGRYYDVVGKDFINAVTYLQGVPHSGLPDGLSLTVFLGALSHNWFLHALINLGTVIWFYLLLYVMAAVCVRNLYAWAADGSVPRSLARLGRGGPITATFIVIGIAVLMAALQAFAGVGVVNYIALFSLCFLVAGIAAMLYPYRRRELFQNSPAMVRWRVLGLPLIVIAGAVNTILFAVVLWSSLTNPGFSGVRGLIPTILVLAVYLSGAAVFAWSRRRTGELPEAS